MARKAEDHEHLHPSDVIRLRPADHADPRAIFENSCVRVIHVAGANPEEAVVSFTGIGLKLGSIQQEEFATTLSGICDVYYVTDFRRTWFNDCLHVVIEVLCRHLEMRGTRSVMTLGNSMGGSGAIAFARHLPNCRTAVAFVPQSSIHRNVAPFEMRYDTFVSGVQNWELPDVAACVDPRIAYHLFVGDKDSTDLQHAQRFLEAGAGACSLYVIRGADHNVARQLKARGVSLRDVIAATRTGRDAVHAQLRGQMVEDQLGKMNMEQSPAPIIAAPQNFRNGLELQVFGLQRSGNHGIIGWIAQQFEKKVFFFNNVTAFADPVTHWHIGAVANTRALPRKGTPALEAIREQPKEVLFCSYENLNLRHLATRNLVSDHDALLGRSRRTVRLLLLRDFFNWLSSRLKLFEYRGQDMVTTAANIDGMINLWLLYAQEFHGTTDFLGDSAVVKISYPRWVIDAEYRAWILGAVGAPLRDNSNSYVPDVGGGSSFDRTRLSGRASEMGVQERWGFLLEDPRFEAARARIAERRAEIEPLNAALFGALWIL